jgi:hypothetical protein
MQNFGNSHDGKLATPLNPYRVSKVELFEAPLQDKDQLKRVILFSDLGDESESQLQSGMNEQGNFLISGNQ